MSDRVLPTDNVYSTDFRRTLHNQTTLPAIAHPGNAAAPLDSASDAAPPSLGEERATLVAMLEKRDGHAR